MRAMILTTALFANTALSGGGLHDADFILDVQDGQLVTGAVASPTDDPVFPVRIKSALLGAEGFPNFTNDPGFNAIVGALPANLEIGFSIIRAPRIWDPINQDFETIATDTITVRAAAQNFQAPSSDTIVEGIVFGQSTPGSTPTFHHHMQYLVNGGIPPAVDAVLLLTLELWTTSPSVAPTDPIYLVFAQGESASDLDLAIEWVEDNLIDDSTGCLADLNNDTELDFFDINEFVSRFTNNDPSVDYNNDGSFDFFDINTFITSFTSDCP